MARLALRRRFEVLYLEDGLNGEFIIRRYLFRMLTRKEEQE
jgi:hypothetical protein